MIHFPQTIRNTICGRSPGGAVKLSNDPSRVNCPTCETILRRAEEVK